MELKIEKRIRDGICHSVNRDAKDINKHMKDYDKNKDWDVHNLYGWAISQKLSESSFEVPGDFFEPVEVLRKLWEGYQKVMKDIFLELIFNFLKIYIKSKTICIFTWEDENWKGRKTCH